VAGAFDSLYGFTARKARGQITRRDLLLQIADLDRSHGKSGKGTPTAQLSFDVADSDSGVIASGLPEMTSAQRVKSELEVLSLDVSGHVMDFYSDVVKGLNIVQSRDLLGCRSKEIIFIAGVKSCNPKCHRSVAASGWCFLPSTIQLDRSMQLSFEDAQGPFAHDLFNSWILLVRGEIRRTGPRGFHCAQRGVGSWGVFVDCGLTAGLQRSTSWYLLIKFPIVTHRINELL